MSFLKLSMMNLRQNLKNYGMYIFSMVFSVIVFYNFATLGYSEQFKSIQDFNTISVISGLCAMVLFLFFIFFISYSSSFFIEQRKKEFGIYTFMGIENNKIALLFAQEGLFTGIISLIIGIIGGIAVNKMFLMTLVKLANKSNIIKFEISTHAIIATSFMFLGILVLVFIKEYILLVRTDITKLLNATNMYQNVSTKNKTIQGILGLVIILGGYISTIYFRDLGINFMIAIIIAVLSVIIGTAFLFKGFFTFIMSKIIKNKKILYKNTNIVSYNNVIFRIKDSNKVLGQVTVLITCCLTSVIVAFGMKTLFDNTYNDEFPYSIYYMSRGENDDKIVNKAISLSKEEVDFKVNIDLIDYKTKSKISDYLDKLNIVRYSDIEYIMKHKSIDNEKRLLKNKPKDGEGFIIPPKNMLNASGINLDEKIAGKEIKLKDYFASSIMGNQKESLLIVSDNDYKYFLENIKDVNVLNYKGITLKNFENTSQISKYVKDNSDMKLHSVDTFDKHKFDFINSVYFIGIFLGLVFMISLGSIMYFKCISDANKDKVRFDTLRKIGTSQEYINKVIFKQVGIYFLLPIIIGIIHSIVAGHLVKDTFNIESYSSVIKCIGTFSIIYLMYYFITARKYIEITK
ncbi:ABC transporter permease [Romboutsia maritimum]|uniref:ABC transporter permease n=1 Tax=Romboutsia maritimum TaxID=2020948 RepID=A0A255HQX3_9FIRM|nr:FtsX-like permease family protein [Romboutsia maritimum]RDY23885.1 ABC transporter permease [Romboutsia maritimum]